MQTDNIEKPNRFYEGVVILHADVKEADQKEFFRRNAEIIQKYAGKVNHLDTWGRRRLANPINKAKLGVYFHTTFESQGECVAELERVMKIDDRVLRFLHTRLDERKSLSAYVEDYKKVITESNKREQEREAKKDMRRREASAGRGGAPGGGRRFRDDHAEEAAAESTESSEEHD